MNKHENIQTNKNVAGEEQGNETNKRERGNIGNKLTL
jgi:hypothetical protein